jgi:hypothetical protein
MNTKTTTTRRLADLIPVDHQADSWLEHFGQLERRIEEESAELLELAAAAREYGDEHGRLEGSAGDWQGKMAAHMRRLGESAFAASEALMRSLR